MGKRLSLTDKYTKWHTFEYGNATFEFYLDGRFTICLGYQWLDMGKIGVSVGYAFCSTGDEYDGNKGLWLSLRRCLKNAGIEEHSAQQVELACQQSIEDLFK